MKKSEESLLNLFFSFAKVGVMTFGGGLSMLPMLEHEITEKRHWATEDEILEYFAVGQCTPGIIAVNTATFVGYKTRGVTGGIAATLGVVFPSVMIITVLSAFFSMMGNNPYFIKAFAGIRLAVVALIASSLIKLSKKTVKGFESGIIAVIVFGTQLFFGISPVIIVLTAIVYALIKFCCNKGKGVENALS